MKTFKISTILYAMKISKSVITKTKIPWDIGILKLGLDTLQMFRSSNTPKIQ